MVFLNGLPADERLVSCVFSSWPRVAESHDFHKKTDAELEKIEQRTVAELDKVVAATEQRVECEVAKMRAGLEERVAIISKRLQDE